MRKNRGKLLKGSAISILALLFVMFQFGSALAQSSSVSFEIIGVNDLGEPITDYLDQARCDAGSFVEELVLTFEDIDMESRVEANNDGSQTATYRVNLIDHYALAIESNGQEIIAAPPINQIGQDYCPSPSNYDLPCANPPSDGPSEQRGAFVGNWNWILEQGVGVTNFEALLTHADGIVIPLPDSHPDYSHYVGNGTVPVNFTASAASSQFNGGSTNGNIFTNAYGGVRLDWVCDTPGLDCNGKTFSNVDMDIDTGIGTATATIVFENSGDIAFTDLVITDELDPGLSYQPGSANIGEPDTITGDATSGFTLTWNYGDLAANTELTVIYDVDILLDYEQSACNNAEASTAEYNLTTSQTCEDCVRRGPPPPPPIVPAFTAAGLLAFAGLFPLAWVFISRRKRS